MDRLDELAVLIATVDAGSLAGASRRLRRSPPAVTRALAALEQRIGARLIERTTRRLAPTAKGQALAELARTLLVDYDAMTSSVADTTLRGALRVTAPVQFGRRHVAPVIGVFLDRHPTVQVELVLNDRNLDLVEEGLDIAIRIGHLAGSTLRTRKLGWVGSVLVASPAYLTQRGTPRHPKDLAQHDTIFGTARGAPPEWRFGTPGQTVSIRVEPRFLVNEAETQRLAAKAGQGIARLLSYQAADDLAAGTLIRLLSEFEPPALPVQLVTHGGFRVPSKARAFLDLAWERLHALPALHIAKND